MEGIEIRVAERSEARQAAAVLAHAFHADLAFSWTMQDEGSRSRRLRRYFLTELRHESLRHGAADAAYADGRVVGAAVWFSPDAWSPTTPVGALTGYLRAFGRRITVGSQVMSAAARAHPRERPHWYLASIGVYPALTGRGVGAALLRSRLQHCDTQDLPAYLESSNPRNVPIYERFGFQVTGVLPLADGAPVLTTMWRPAGGAAAAA